MRIEICILLFISLHLYNCADTTSVLLKGTIISSDYDSISSQYAFDGIAETVFQSTKPSNGWVGLELGKAYIITKIGWLQNDKDSEKYMLGVFEGSNDEKFLNAFPLSMITIEGKIGVMNYITIDVTYPFKYVRYVGPNNQYSIISGLEFYGYESTTQISIEEAKFYQPTNLPLVILHNEDGLEPQSKVFYINGNIVILDKGKLNIQGSGTIRLRGYSTMRLPKSPYKIKFDEKKKPLDLKANARSWNLLANYADKTLIRNQLALKISEMFGNKFVPSCRPVDLMFNGEFKGNYGLCDKIQIKKDRVNITKLKEEVEDDMSGGYIIEPSGHAPSEKLTWKTTRGIPFYISDPGKHHIILQQKDYIENYFNQIESEVYDGNIDHIDLDSFSKYILTQELCGNPDTFWGYYMYKERRDNLLYSGPVWDFDTSFGNDIRAYNLLNKTTFLIKGGPIVETLKDFIIKILSKDKALQHLKNTWKQKTKSDVTKAKILSYIDTMVKNVYESQKLNFKRWKILDLIIGQTSPLKGTYDEHVKFLKTFFNTRFPLIEKLLEKVDTNNIETVLKYYYYEFIE